MIIMIIAIIIATERPRALHLRPGRTAAVLTGERELREWGSPVYRDQGLTQVAMQTLQAGGQVARQPGSLAVGLPGSQAAQSQRIKQITS